MLKKRKEVLFFTILLLIMTFVFSGCGINFLSNPFDDNQKNEKAVTSETDKASASNSESKHQDNPDEKVTDDYLPGTYYAENGDFIAIHLDDASILEESNHTKDQSTGTIIDSDVKWLEEKMEVDIANKTISLAGDSEEQPTFTYTLEKKNLTLTNQSTGSEKVFQKTTDTYDADVLLDQDALSMEDVVGVYRMATYEESENDVVEYAQIEPENDTNVKVLEFHPVKSEDLSESHLSGLNESARFKSFFKGNAIPTGAYIRDNDKGLQFLSRKCCMDTQDKKHLVKTDLSLIDLQASVDMYTVRTAEAREQNMEEQNSYLLPNSNTEYLDKEDIQYLSAWEIKLAKNEIYARHGRRFNNEDIQSYFDEKSWYHGTIEPDAFDEDILNDYEKDNVTFLTDYEEVKEEEEKTIENFDPNWYRKYTDYTATGGDTYLEVIFYDYDRFDIAIDSLTLYSFDGENYSFNTEAEAVYTSDEGVSLHYLPDDHELWLEGGDYDGVTFLYD